MTTNRKKQEDYSWMRRGEDAPRAKLTADEVRAMRAEMADGARVCDVAKKYKVAPSNVSSIKTGNTWRSIL